MWATLDRLTPDELANHTGRHARRPLLPPPIRREPLSQVSRGPENRIPAVTVYNLNGLKQPVPGGGTKQRTRHAGVPFLDILVLIQRIYLVSDFAGKPERRDLACSWSRTDRTPGRACTSTARTFQGRGVDLGDGQRLRGIQAAEEFVRGAHEFFEEPPEHVELGLVSFQGMPLALHFIGGKGQIEPFGGS